MNREKKVTSTELIMKVSKKTPGVGQYKNMDQKPKIYGYYGNTEPKVTGTASVIFIKSKIPAPNKYESRGKSMSDLIDDKLKKYNRPSASPEMTKLRTTSKIAKTNDPGPQSYKVEEALENSA